MASKSVKLLLVENVESLGIVGDVVNVRTGYARNFLLPRSLATQPNDAMIKELSGKRADAQKAVEAHRQHRVALVDKLKGVEITLIRSCNDQGILYGAITQQDLAAALKELGHVVSPRDVRITQTIKRVDNYDIHIKLDADLDSIVKLHVKPDRELPADAKRAEEAQGEGGAGAGADERPSRRRDAWMVPDESSRVVGWGTGKKEEGKAEAKGEGKKGDKGEKKEKKAKGDGDTKPEAKAAKAEKPEGGEKKGKKKAE